MRYLAAFLTILLIGASSPVPTLVGTWQGIIDGPAGKTRRVMVITRSNGVYDVTIHSLDETDVPIVTKSVSVSGPSVTMNFDLNTDPWYDYHRVYKATLSAQGSELTGTWSGDGIGAVMNYERVPHATWPIIEGKVTMVPAQPGVQIEAVDYGGRGRNLILLQGAGGTAHSALSLYEIVPNLIKRYHVYAITRRGFGNSSRPPLNPQNYSADRLGDDVLAVMDALHIDKPVLIGHSFAGEELSDIGTRFPHRVSGLVYLEAGYRYAIVGPDKREAMLNPKQPPLLRTYLEGSKDFTGPINVPILAIFAYPGNPKEGPSADRTPAKIKAANSAELQQINAFAKALPNAKVIQIPNASHFVYDSNKSDVLDDINAFMAKVSRVSP